MVNVGRARIPFGIPVRIRLPPAPGLLLFAQRRQFAVEEFGSSAVGADPMVPGEQVVN